jgi:hypothetical protein
MYRPARWAGQPSDSSCAWTAAGSDTLPMNVEHKDYDYTVDSERHLRHRSVTLTAAWNGRVRCHTVTTRGSPRDPGRVGPQEVRSVIWRYPG